MINNLISIVPICSYLNTYTQKRQICKDNRRKMGIYRWTNLLSGKSYVGSSVNLSIRFENYLNISYLKKAIEKNNSKIYRALLKYGYFNFKLDILEYCDTAIIIEREQYYLDLLKPEYNILKFAGSSYGFKHSKNTIERLRIVNLGRKHSETTKLKLSANWKAHPVTIINNKTGEIKLFKSIRQAAKFIGRNYSYLTKCLRKHKFYIEREYYITKIININNEN